MSESYYTNPASRRDIEEKAYAWREALEIPPFCARPDMTEILEWNLPKLIPQFALFIGSIEEMKNAEAYTLHNPPAIRIRRDVYESAINFDGRARMTLAHELGHLVLHKNAKPLHRAPSEYQVSGKIPAFANTEYQANVFASAFLVPEWIASEYRNPIELAQHCGVSLEAARISLEKTHKQGYKKLHKVVLDYINGS